MLVAAAFLAAYAAAATQHLLLIRADRNRYLYYPEGWALRSSGAAQSPSPESDAPEELSVGGGSLGVLPLNIKFYRVRQGDTLSGIAERFHVDLDTVASLNREWGSGVHLIRIGEEIKIPNQDGIFIDIRGSLDQVCEERGVPADVVLKVNGLERDQVGRGASLFFPGVQHTGIERSVMVGTAFLKPVGGWISSRYGYRQDPFAHQIHFHRGVDIAAPAGTTVRSSLDGWVAASGWDPVLGNFVMIRHQVGYATVYGHLQQIYVRKGAAVTRGQRIGAVGTTGRSTGPHLHFEIRRYGMTLDPQALMTSWR